MNCVEITGEQLDRKKSTRIIKLLRECPRLSINGADVGCLFARLSIPLDALCIRNTTLSDAQAGDITSWIHATHTLELQNVVVSDPALSTLVAAGVSCRTMNLNCGVESKAVVRLAGLLRYNLKVLAVNLLVDSRLLAKSICIHKLRYLHVLSPYDLPIFFRYLSGVRHLKITLPALSAFKTFLMTVADLRILELGETNFLEVAKSLRFNKSVRKLILPKFDTLQYRIIMQLLCTNYTLMEICHGDVTIIVAKNYRFLNTCLALLQVARKHKCKFRVRTMTKIIMSEYTPELKNTSKNVIFFFLFIRLPKE